MLYWFQKEDMIMKKENLKVLLTIAIIVGIIVVLAISFLAFNKYYSNKDNREKEKILDINDKKVQKLYSITELDRINHTNSIKSKDKSILKISVNELNENSKKIMAYSQIKENEKNIKPCNKDNLPLTYDFNNQTYTCGNQLETKTFSKDIFTKYYQEIFGKNASFNNLYIDTLDITEKYIYNIKDNTYYLYTFDGGFSDYIPTYTLEEAKEINNTITLLIKENNEEKNKINYYLYSFIKEEVTNNYLFDSVAKIDK